MTKGEKKETTAEENAQSTHSDQTTVFPKITQRLSPNGIEKKLSLALIPIFLFAIVVLVALNIPAAYEPPFVLSIMNTVFLGIIPLVIVYITYRVISRSGSVSVFMMGCGILIFGLGSIVAGWVNPLYGGPNITVTIHNTCACLGSIFILAGAVMSHPPAKSGNRRLSAGTIAAAYAGIEVFVTIFSLATLQGMIPPFFVPGSGPTVLRQIILENAVGLFAISSVIFMGVYRKGRSDFFFWYSVALALIAIGLLAVFFQPSVGSLIGWVGRTAQYIGFVFALYAVLIARKTATAKGLPLENIIGNFFVDAEQNYRQLVETATDAIVTIDKDFRVLLWNSAAERMFGYPRDEAIGASFLELVIDDPYIAVFKKDCGNIPDRDTQATSPKPVEINCKRKCGEIFPVELTVSRRWQKGLLILTCILRDITERKQAKERADHLASFPHLTPILLLEVDAHGSILYANPAIRHVLEEMGEDDLHIFIPQDIRARLDGTVIKEFYHELRDIRIHDRVFQIKIYFTPEFSSIRIYASDITDRKVAEDALRNAHENLEIKVQKRTAQLSDANRDLVAEVAERKKTDERLQESEAHLRQITDTITSVFYIHDRVSNKFISVSPAYEKIWKRSCQSLIDNPYSFLESVHPDDLPWLQESIRKELKEGIYVDTDYRIIQPNGNVHWIRSRNFPITDETGKTFRVAGIAEDITDLKKADLSLKAAKEYSETLIQTANAMIIGLDNHGTVTLFNEAAEAITGYTAAELAGRNWFSVIVPKEQYPHVWEEFNRLLTGGLPKNFENPILTKSGEERYIVWKNSEIRNNGQTIGTISFGIDITDRKRAEVAIRESEERFHSMFERHDSVMLLIDPETGKIIDANLAAAQFYGKSQEELCSQSIDEINCLSKEEVAAERMKALREKKNFFIFPHRLASGEIRTVEVHSSPIVVGGKAVLFSVISDITERKRAEDALKESERKYRNLVNTLNEGIWYVTPDLKTSYLNPRMAGMLGYTVDEMTGRPLADFIEPGSMRVVEEQVERRKKGHIDQYEITLKKKDGRNLIGGVTASPLLDEQGGFIGSVAGIEDITERKHNEDVLTLANRIFSISNHHQQITPMLDEVVHTIQEYTGCDSVGIRLLDARGNIPYTAYTGFAPSFYERESPLNILKDECMCIYVIRGDANYDLPVITSKGSFWCNGTTKFLAGVSDEDTGRTRNVCNEVGYESVALVAIKQGDTILGLIHIADHREGMVPLETVEVLEDISQALGSAIQRLLAENGIRNSLAEKEILLQEIHHRVKNNLAGVISIIDLQIAHLTDPAHISLLRDLEARIRSMALVHESLYLTKDLAQINFAEYTENLTRYLFQIYETGTGVRCRIDMGNITMPIGTAIPCGLVMSEIVTNALKYAFPDTFSCTAQRNELPIITLTLLREGNTYRLRIADNGIGIPEETDVTATSSLGLYLIRFIVKHQLRGTLELSTDNGTAYTIQFSEPEVREQKDNA